MSDDTLRLLEEKIRSADQPELLELVGELARVQALTIARVAALSAEGPDELIGIAEASTKLGIGVSTLYRRAESYPFTVINGRTVRFSRRGIERWIESKRRKEAA